MLGLLTVQIGNSALDWVNSDESLKLLNEHFKQKYEKIEVKK